MWNTYTWSSLVPLKAWLWISLKPFPYSTLEQNYKVHTVTSQRNRYFKQTIFWIGILSHGLMPYLFLWQISRSCLFHFRCWGFIFLRSFVIFHPTFSITCCFVDYNCNASSFAPKPNHLYVIVSGLRVSVYLFALSLRGSSQFSLQRTCFQKCNSCQSTQILVAILGFGLD